MRRIQGLVKVVFMAGITIRIYKIKPGHWFFSVTFFASDTVVRSFQRKTCGRMVKGSLGHLPTHKIMAGSTIFPKRRLMDVQMTTGACIGYILKLVFFLQGVSRMAYIAGRRFMSTF